MNEVTNIAEYQGCFMIFIHINMKHLTLCFDNYKEAKEIFDKISYKNISSNSGDLFEIDIDFRCVEADSHFEKQKIFHCYGENVDNLADKILSL